MRNKIVKNIENGFTKDSDLSTKVFVKELFESNYLEIT